MNEKEISVSDLKLGLISCLSHSEGLLSDSEVLLSKKRYAAATSLAILAYEEASKSRILALHLQQNKSMPWKIWSAVSHSGDAHKNKLTLIQAERKLGLQTKFTSKDESILDVTAKKLGLPSLQEHKLVLIEIDLLEKILPSLNSLKQDCFYLNYDSKNKNWINFDTLFNDDAKIAIPTFLIILTKRTIAWEKYLEDCIKKSFDQYTDKDWKIVRKLKSRKNLEKVFKQTNSKKLSRLSNTAIFALMGYSGKSFFS